MLEQFEQPLPGAQELARTSPRRRYRRNDRQQVGQNQYATGYGSDDRGLDDGTRTKPRAVANTRQTTSSTAMPNATLWAGPAGQAAFK